MSMKQTNYRVSPKASIKCNYALGACPDCGQTIKRGDLVTRVKECEGMRLRPVGWRDGMFNTKYTGERIVHKDCAIAGLWTDELAEQEADRINNLKNSPPPSPYYWSD